MAITSITYISPARRIQRHKKTAFLSCQEVGKAQFLQQLEKNNCSPFMKARCPQDQRDFCGEFFFEQIFQEPEAPTYESEAITRRSVRRGKTIVRKPKNYFRLYADECEDWKEEMLLAA